RDEEPVLGKGIRRPEARRAARTGLSRNRKAHLALVAAQDPVLASLRRRVGGVHAGGAACASRLSVARSGGAAGALSRVGPGTRTRAGAPRLRGDVRSAAGRSAGQ